MGPLQTPDVASSSFVSTNQFAVLTNSEYDTEYTGVPLQANSRKSRIPPIVIYNSLENHSATHKKANETLGTPVEVKTQSQSPTRYEISYGLQRAFG